MSAPNYDWLKDINTVQREYIQKHYPGLWPDYCQFGYATLLYDWNQKIDQVYDEVKDLRVVVKADLPEDTTEAIRKLQRVHHDAYNMEDIVVPVSDYHVAFISDSMMAYNELQTKLAAIPVLPVKDLETEVFHCKNCAVIIDDITMQIDEELLENMELYAVPFIRRSIAGWRQAYIDNTALNIFNNFIERFRPCKAIR